ncbi:succinate dehydrogenase, cytochrome b556 subunit [Sneathiella sp. HT1-7]|jgi:succinate dehydrogenase / fumarate reductase cytochrome b subunit|uniref:succinate dehydrogenase, cytochrome b556 subunit n=1 Tax=Sneathiella sp. HT1-7 TaxID=2887192 RepID=UPI001D135A8B|nr:succinate dehydrogenase, cytochrome b556 subunit [Sneathiella sp. HT1-7]MCC3303642.1 succinate dehydrogenase, cytochrome b556 subunit [Sneathiella sp. HT1-7]
MAKIERPLSPHLQIYKPQITMVTSITHRATGIALGVGTLLLAWWLIAVAAGPEAYATVTAFTTSWFGQIILFGFTWSLFYHLCNGIRHLFWDMGQGFELPTMRKSGMAAIIASIVLTLLTWIIAYAMGA